MRLVRDWSVEQIDSNPKLLADPDRIVFVANDQLKVIEIDSLMQRSLPCQSMTKRKIRRFSRSTIMRTRIA